MSTAHIPDLVLRNGRFTTLDRAKPIASAVAIREGKFVAVGDDAEVVPLAGGVRVRRRLPGARPQSRARVVDQCAGLGPARVLGRARLRVLGGLT
jgi:hypothetical protein